jgi:hypothetical protein
MEDGTSRAGDRECGRGVERGATASTASGAVGVAYACAPRRCGPVGVSRAVGTRRAHSAVGGGYKTFVYRVYHVPDERRSHFRSSVLRNGTSKARHSDLSPVDGVGAREQSSLETRESCDSSTSLTSAVVAVHVFIVSCVRQSVCSLRSLVLLCHRNPYNVADDVVLLRMAEPIDRPTASAPQAAAHGPSRS